MIGRAEPWAAETGREVVATFAAMKGGLLPALHALQARFGHVPADAVPLLAETFNLSRADVHGTVTFYHDFRATPAGRHVVKLCRAEACQAMGSERVYHALSRRLGIAWHETTPDGAVTLEPVFCLGLCATAPAGLLDDEPLVRLDPDRLAVRLEELGA